jgi:threonine/homoserine/homoserine lactone efflux protein
VRAEAIIRTEGTSIEDTPASRRRLYLFFMLDAASVVLVLVPGLIYLFVLDNGLSERDLILYVVGLIAVQAAIVGLLLWKLGILRGTSGGKT